MQMRRVHYNGKRLKASMSQSRFGCVFSTDVDAVVDEIARKEPLVTTSKTDQVRKLIMRILHIIYIYIYKTSFLASACVIYDGRTCEIVLIFFIPVTYCMYISTRINMYNILHRMNDKNLCWVGCNYCFAPFNMQSIGQPRHSLTSVQG